MKYLGRESDLGSKTWVELGEPDVEEEKAALVGTARWPRDGGLKVNVPLILVQGMDLHS